MIDKEVPDQLPKQQFGSLEQLSRADFELQENNAKHELQER